MNIKKIVIREVGCFVNKQGEIKATDSFVNDIGCDSLDCIEIVMLFEEMFDIEIDEHECDSDKFTVDDAIKLITSALKT